MNDERGEVFCADVAIDLAVGYRVDVGSELADQLAKPFLVLETIKVFDDNTAAKITREFLALDYFGPTVGTDQRFECPRVRDCLLYTSDAADE